MNNSINVDEFNKAIQNGTLKIQGGSLISGNKSNIKQGTIFSDPSLLPKEKKVKKVPVLTYGEQLEIDNKELLDYLREKVRINQAIFINGNIPSSKNSRDIQRMYTGKSMCCNAPYNKTGHKEYRCNKCGKPCQLGTRPILRWSITVQTYIDERINIWVSKKPIWDAMTIQTKYPVKLGVYFIRDTNRKFDYINGCQICADIMTNHEWIPDDDAEHLKPFFLGYHVNTEKTGLILCIMDEQLFKFIQI